MAVDAQEAIAQAKKFIAERGTLTDAEKKVPKFKSDETPEHLLEERHNAFIAAHTDVLVAANNLVTVADAQTGDLDKAATEFLNGMERFKAADRHKDLTYNDLPPSLDLTALMAKEVGVTDTMSPVSANSTLAGEKTAAQLQNELVAKQMAVKNASEAAMQSIAKNYEFANAPMRPSTATVTADALIRAAKLAAERQIKVGISARETPSDELSINFYKDLSRAVCAGKNFAEDKAEILQKLKAEYKTLDPNSVAARNIGQNITQIQILQLAESVAKISPQTMTRASIETITNLRDDLASNLQRIDGRSEKSELTTHDEATKVLTAATGLVNAANAKLNSPVTSPPEAQTMASQAIQQPVQAQPAQKTNELVAKQMGAVQKAAKVYEENYALDANPLPLQEVVTAQQLIDAAKKAGPILDTRKRPSERSQSETKVIETYNELGRSFISGRFTEQKATVLQGLRNEYSKLEIHDPVAKLIQQNIEGIENLQRQALPKKVADTVAKMSAESMTSAELGKLNELRDEMAVAVAFTESNLTSLTPGERNTHIQAKKVLAELNTLITEVNVKLYPEFQRPEVTSLASDGVTFDAITPQDGVKAIIGDTDSDTDSDSSPNKNSTHPHLRTRTALTSVLQVLPVEPAQMLQPAQLQSIQQAQPQQAAKPREKAASQQTSIFARLKKFLFGGKEDFQPFSDSRALAEKKLVQQIREEMGISASQESLADHAAHEISHNPLYEAQNKVVENSLYTSQHAPQQDETFSNPLYEGRDPQELIKELASSAAKLVEILPDTHSDELQTKIETYSVELDDCRKQLHEARGALSSMEKNMEKLLGNKKDPTGLSKIRLQGNDIKKQSAKISDLELQQERLVRGYDRLIVMQKELLSGTSVEPNRQAKTLTAPTASASVIYTETSASQSTDSDLGNGRLHRTPK